MSKAVYKIIWEYGKLTQMCYLFVINMDGVFRGRIITRLLGAGGAGVNGAFGGGLVELS